MYLNNNNRCCLYYLARLVWITGKVLYLIFIQDLNIKNFSNEITDTKFYLTLCSSLQTLLFNRKIYQFLYTYTLARVHSSSWATFNMLTEIKCLAKNKWLEMICAGRHCSGIRNYFVDTYVFFTDHETFYCFYYPLPLKSPSLMVVAKEKSFFYKFSNNSVHSANENIIFNKKKT